MKKLLVLALTLVTGISVYAQGRFAWSTVTVSTPSLLISTNMGGVTGLAGGGAGAYYYAIFTGAAASSISPSLMPTFMATNHGTLAGRFASGTISGAAAATPFQVRGWSSSLGADWAQVAPVWMQALGFFGTSALGTVTPTVAPTPAPTIWGTGAGQVTGFEMVFVPEPSTIALGALGLVGLFFIRRRK